MRWLWWRATPDDDTDTDETRQLLEEAKVRQQRVDEAKQRRRRVLAANNLGPRIHAALEGREEH